MRKTIAVVLILATFLSLVGCFGTTIQWELLKLSDKLPEPASNVGSISSDSDTELSVRIEKFSQQQYKDYLMQCKAKGFTIDPDERSNVGMYDAYNNDGWKLSLNYSEYGETLTIDLEAPLQLGFYQWPNSEVAQLLPKPKSTVGKMQWEYSDHFFLYVGETTIDEYNAYVNECEQKGFAVDYEKGDKYYRAYNENGFYISLSYEGYCIISIEIKSPEENEEGENDVIGANGVRVPMSEWDCKYENYADIEKVFKNAGFTNISTKILYDIVLGWTKEGEVERVSIDGVTNFQKDDVFSKDAEIVITYHMKEEDDPKNIKVPENSSKYDGMNYLEVKQAFQDMGFTNIELGEVTTESSYYTNGEILCVEINGWSFDAGDVFKPTDKVYIKYYMVIPPEPSGPVFYSTNDYETAKKGNTGVFSYKSKNGSYDVYWIIDFNEGYIYWFTEGAGDSTCDKVKIVSGDLNYRITATWHVGGEEWSWYLHFKYENHPETLIVNDHNGLAIEFGTTDLSKALILRDTKRIIER